MIGPEVEKVMMGEDGKHFAVSGPFLKLLKELRKIDVPTRTDAASGIT